MRAVDRLWGAVGATVCVLALGGACATGDSRRAAHAPPTVTAVRFATPVLPGSRLYVEGTELVQLSSSAALRLEVGSTTTWLARSDDGDKLAFQFAEENILDIGAADVETQATIVDGDTRSAPVPLSLAVAESVPPVLEDGPSGDAFRNEDRVLRGGGFLTADEGTVTAEFRGTFRAEGGGVDVEANANLPVRIVEPTDRNRGIVRLTTALGGPRPGSWRGTVTLHSTFLVAGPLDAESREVKLAFGAPAIFDVSPGDVSLEHVVAVRGGGFLGIDNADESTLVRLEGAFARPGASATPIEPAEIVLNVRRGDDATFVLESNVVDDTLVAALFGDRRGTFMGTMTPVTLSRDVEVRGEPAPVTLTLGAVRQVVWVRFLPSYYTSLVRFGLNLATSRIEALLKARIESIYARWPVDVRFEKPTDVSENGYATVEVGGPDPNGLGLFGYDNTPGKDVGNLRLFDAIGGANATTQADGYPGYGGVFIESLLLFSTHPGTAIEGAGPVPDPLFDDIFDPVRTRAATHAELEGAGSATRVAAVERAVRAFGNMLGETTAHELGHSLGLADPYGPPTSYHDPGDNPGCLMEGGSARPVGERAAEEGYAESIFCHDEDLYLDDVFAIDP
ncbi:MAG: hypothetical protein R3A78_10260 [Polyangiales bacterium]